MTWNLELLTTIDYRLVVILIFLWKSSSLTLNNTWSGIYPIINTRCAHFHRSVYQISISPVFFFGITNKFSIQNAQIKLRMFHFNQRFEYAASYQTMYVVLY